MKKKKEKAASGLRKGRIAVAMAGIVLCMVIADNLRRDFFMVENRGAITVDGVFRTKPVEEPQGQVAFEPGSQPFADSCAAHEPGYNVTQAQAAELSQGLLAVSSAANPATPKSDQQLVNLSNYKNDFYSVDDETLVLDKNAADALNAMMQDYSNATGLNDFLVYGTTNTSGEAGSVCPKAYPDCASGYTVDLALYGYLGMIGFDGYDAEGWIIENCHNYGFIVRYPAGKESVTGETFCPWHLRYVGEPHAAAMKQYNMCLEEYISFLSSSSVQQPFEYSSGTANYKIYTVPSEGEITNVQVPVGGNCDISGDGSGSYIVTARVK
ncbi:MAG: M15 family metallopeptidase [Ruminococcus sp.]|nr:M15 family metallopeptidase [Ruminococcus sp.]